MSENDILFITDVLYEGSSTLSHDDARTYGDAFSRIELNFKAIRTLAPCRPVTRALVDKTKEVNAV